MNEINLLIQSIKDFFTKPMLKIALVPLLLTLVIMYIIFFTAAGYGFDSLHVVIEQSQNGQTVIIDDNAPFYYAWASQLIYFLFQHSVTAWLVGFLFYTVGSIFVMMFSLFITLIIIGFLTPSILKILHKRHYAHLKINGSDSLIMPLWILIKSSFVMILLFLLLIPLYFIPFINIIAFNIPFYYFFHKMINFDVATSLVNDQEYYEVYVLNKTSFRLRTLFLYFISMIPSITLFSAVFYIIYLGHAYFRTLQTVRGLEVIDDDNFSEQNEKEEKQKLIN